MARDIEELLQHVMIYASAAAEPVAIRFIREAAADFCKKTRSWREWDEFSIDPDTCNGICSIQDSRILEILHARLDGRDLKPVTEAWLDAELPNWHESEDTDGARYITQTRPDTVTVVPRQAGDLKARFVLYPSNDALTLPDFLVDHHATVIAQGAAGRLLITPDVTYSNPQLGASLLSEFNSVLGSEKFKAARGQQGARLRTMGRYL